MCGISHAFFFFLLIECHHTFGVLSRMTIYTSPRGKSSPSIYLHLINGLCGAIYNQFFLKSHSDGFEAVFQIVRCSIVFWPIKRWTVTSTVFDVSPLERTITVRTQYYANVLTYFLLEQVCCTILFRMKIKLNKNWYN